LSKSANRKANFVGRKTADGLGCIEWAGEPEMV
jgi:hypothetical protein